MIYYKTLCFKFYDIVCYDIRHLSALGLGAAGDDGQDPPLTCPPPNLCSLIDE